MTQSEILLMHLLSLGDKHPYEIEQVIQRAQMRYWSEIGFSSIYAVLGKLTKKGLVSFRYEKHPGAPRRKVFHLEEAGREALDAEKERLIVEPAPEFPDLHVGVIIADSMDPERYSELLRRYLESQRLILEHLRSFCSKFIEEREGVASVYRRMELHHEADKRWVEEILG